MYYSLSSGILHGYQHLQNCIHLTSGQARKLALISQHLPISGFSRGLKGTFEAIDHLGYVQIDTISVIERAHHHTLYNRVPHYRHGYLDKLVEQRKIFEYWSHAAAYLSFDDYRYCLPRMHAIKQGQRHWYKKNVKLMNYVLQRITADGALQAKDFEEHTGYSGGMWEWGPIKQAIEHLFMQGDLLVTKRVSFQKVFDLAERVIPAHINTAKPSRLEYAHYLIRRHIRAHGIGHLSEFGYLRKAMGPVIKRALNEKIESGELLEIKLKTQKDRLFVTPDYQTTLDKRLAHCKAKILSPFDNLVIQRKRIQRLFEFDYQLECYLPEKKRKHGYFTLPVLWQGNLVARMDAKADRKNNVFIIRNLALETKLRKVDEFGYYFSKALNDFAIFNGCEEIRVASKVRKSLKALIMDNL